MTSPTLTDIAAGIRRAAALGLLTRIDQDLVAALVPRCTTAFLWSLGGVPPEWPYPSLIRDMRKPRLERVSPWVPLRSRAPVSLPDNHFGVWDIQDNLLVITGDTLIRWTP
jgi:hypothetical protein